MTDKPTEPTLSPYDDGNSPEEESFLLDAQNTVEESTPPPAPSPDEPELPDVEATGDATAEAAGDATGEAESVPAEAAPASPGEPATRSLWTATPDDSATDASEEATTMIPQSVEDSPTDTVVRRTSLFHPDELGDAHAAPPVAAPAPVSDQYSEYADYEKAPSRAAAHWWSLLSILILTPIAWYLLADAGARFTLAANASWETGVLNYAAIGEFAAGLLVLVVIVLALRGSSLGAWITGPLLVLGGATFLAIPTMVQDFLAPYLESLANYNAFGANLAHHLVASGSTGRFVIAGVALLAAGVVSHGARRSGRREQRIEDALRHYGR